MALTPGTRLGVYAVTAQIGEGGMGQVYLATDTKLKRQVAIKILPPSLAADADRLARFQREAEVLASLNHPNIAAIYGLEESGGLAALVMELVEGDDLSQRLAHGAVPIAEALAIARQIAEALEAAHEQGIIHRDLKPANIKVRNDGTVKVLDFGLAKAIEPAAAASSASMSPTITTPAIMTGIGTILGTAAYMSPEQAKGRPADKRSDLWAFGCVCYEMLTGQRAFQGEDVADTLAAILRGEPDWAALPKGLSPAISAMVRRCLEKDRRRRIGDASTIRFILDDLLPSQIGPITTDTRSRNRRRGWAWASGFAVALIAAIGGAAVGWRAHPAVPDVTVVRLPLSLDQGQAFTSAGRLLVAVSPDGRRIVYNANRRLYLRSLAEPAAREIDGTNLNASIPTFSPDGSSIAFYAGDEHVLKRIALSGGTAVTVCALEIPYGVSWAGDNILFGMSDGVSKGIMRVTASGGKPELIAKVAADEFAYGPQMLPDGDHVMFTIATDGNLTYNLTKRWDRARIVLQSLKSGERKVLLDGGSDARYVPTGHVLYALGGVILAARLDTESLQLRGAPVPVLQGVRRSNLGTTGAAQFGVGGNGTLVYIPGPVSATAGQDVLGLVDRQGAVERLKMPLGTYRDPRISPDGKRLVFGTNDGKEAAIWVYDLSGVSSMRRLTFGGNNRYPVWSADGRRIAFQSDRDGDRAVFWQPADGTGAAQRVTKPAPGVVHVPESIRADGKILLVAATEKSIDLLAHSLEDHAETPFGGVRSSEPINSEFSPDGKWVAYTTTETLQQEIYVQPFPATGAKYQISKIRGHHPWWSRDGKELFFIPSQGLFAVVAVTTAPSFSVGEAVILPRGGFNEGGPTNTRQNDAALDGRIVGVFPAPPLEGDAAHPQLQLVINWFEELKALVPAK